MSEYLVFATSWKKTSNFRELIKKIRENTQVGRNLTTKMSWGKKFTKFRAVRYMESTAVYIRQQPNSKIETNMYSAASVHIQLILY